MIWQSISLITGTFSITTASTTITLQNLTGMTSINWGDGTTDTNLTHTYTSIGTYNFEVSGDITSIGNNAFKDCTSLTNVTIGNSVKRIAEFAFAFCTSLSTINYNGTMTQWSTITLADNWNYNVPATTVHCTDGDVAI